MGQTAFLLVSTLGRLLGTTLLTLGGVFFRTANYRGLFTLAGVSIAFILATMVFRDNIERWFRRLRSRQRMKLRSENENLGKKKRC
jgi:hypothetical protein